MIGGITTSNFMATQKAEIATVSAEAMPLRMRMTSLTVIFLHLDMDAAGERDIATHKKVFWISMQP